MTLFELTFTLSALVLGLALTHMASAIYKLAHEPKLEARPNSAISGEQVVTHDRVNGLEAVFPIHFFAFAIGAAVVSNTHFVNSAL